MGAQMGAPMGQPMGQQMGGPMGAAMGAPPDQLSSQFGQMNIGGQQAPQFQYMQQPQMQQQQQQPQQQPPMQQMHMNQLQPTDLISQPFNVYELDQPPPQINLPPNVRSPN